MLFLIYWWFFSQKKCAFNDAKNRILEYKNTFKLFVDCRINYGLFINLVHNKIDYLKVSGNKETLLRLTQIAEKNKISINPQITVIDITKIKNIEAKINKLLLKRK